MKFRSLIAALSITATSVTAGAQSTVQFQTQRPNPSVVAFGYYVGPFYGTLTSDPTRPTLDLFCVDVLNQIQFGQTYSANITNLSSTNFSLTRGGIAKKESYIKAAWLADQYAGPGISTLQWGGIQAAMWELLNPNLINGGSTVSNNRHEAYWLNQVNTWYNSGGAQNFNTSRWKIVTDVRGAGSATGGVQEFLTTSSSVGIVSTPGAAVTPEPETWVLLGTGLFLVLGVATRRTMLVA